MDYYNYIAQLTTTKETKMDYTNAYSFCISNANVLLKTVFILLERGDEQGAMKTYLDYRFYTDMAQNIAKGKV